MMAYKGRLRVSLSSFRYMKGWGFHYLKYIKGWGNRSFGSVKEPKGLTDELYGFAKSRKRSSFVIDSYLKDSTVKRDANF